MMMMTKLSDVDDDDDADDDKVMCGCDSSRSYSVQELGDRDLLWQKKRFRENCLEKSEFQVKIKI